MDISQNGINLIKQWEGCRLKAYKALSNEQYYTIGWGHYGPDVKFGKTITQEEADALLLTDLKIYVERVEKYNSIYNFNQNQFDALCSFCYNIGSIDQLTSNGNRTIAEIREKIPAYCKSNGSVIKGLQNRRAAELKLFDTPIPESDNYMTTYLKSCFVELVCPCCGKLIKAKIWDKGE